MYVEQFFSLDWERYVSVGAFLFSGLCVVGSSTFALGAMFKGTSAMLPLMLLGRLIFGSGNGSLTSKGLVLIIANMWLNKQ